jgi:hypothetical protein
MEFGAAGELTKKYYVEKKARQLADKLDKLEYI